MECILISKAWTYGLLFIFKACTGSRSFRSNWCTVCKFQYFCYRHESYCYRKALYPYYNNQSRRQETEYKPVLLCWKFDLVSHPAHGKGVSSPYRATSMDFPDPLLPLITIIHCSQQDFQATSYISTEFL